MTTSSPATKHDSPPDSQFIQRWEFGLTVLWMLFFLGVQLPAPVEGGMKILSYPVIAFLVLLNWKRVLYVASRDIPLLLFCGVAIASLLWTVNPEITGDGVRGLIRTYFFGAYIAARYSIREQMSLWTWVLGSATLSSLLVGLALPSYAILQNGWLGSFKYKNFLGFTMSLGIILSLLYVFSAKKLAQRLVGIIGVGLTSVLLILSSSSGGLMSALTLLSILPSYKFFKQNYKIRAVLWIISLLATCGAALILFQLSETILVDVLGKGLSFNGRTPIWELAIAQGLQKPWLGYGLNAFWYSDQGIRVMVNTWAGFRPEGFNSHNAYIEVFLSLGLIGFFLYISNLLACAFRIIVLITKVQMIEVFWFLQPLLLILVSSFADSYDLTLVFIITSLSSVVAIDRLKKYARLRQLGAA
jgi:exopolysaccharide production protein ExoQ